MITFLIGLFINGFLGAIFSSTLSLRRSEPKCLGQKRISMNLLPKAPLGKKEYRAGL